MKDKVYVVGHRNPDTDSICSALSYAYLKNRIGEFEYLPMRAGEISPETKFVLEHFNVEEPKLLTDLRSQIKDADYRKTKGVHKDEPISRAWRILGEADISSLPVVDGKNRVIGIISLGDITKSFIKSCDSMALVREKTPYENVVEVLDGTVICGEVENRTIEGRVVVAGSSTNTVDKLIDENSVVILADNREIQKLAMERGARCLILCLNSDADESLVALAKKKKCVLIKTEKDTFTVSRIISQSVPIESYMVAKNLIKFQEDEFIVDIKPVVAEGKHRYFPVIDEKGRLLGMLSRNDIVNTQKKKVIMVDHNERRQGVTGMMEAQVIEILDHHKIGNINTVYPIFYRNRQYGCTCTIVYQLFKENNVKITKDIAGLMCSAILSDTLMFKSPTCTPVDKAAVLELAQTAEIEYEKYAMDMFSAASDFASKSIDEIFNLDYKKFQSGEIAYGVGQVSSVSRAELDNLKGKLQEYMEKNIERGELNMIFLMLTDILDESTELLCAGSGAIEMARRAFNTEGKDSLMLADTVSRKKQIIPALSEAMQ